MDNILKRIEKAVLSAGAFRTGMTMAKNIKTDASFRRLCEADACGKYGKCYMCPPDIGEIHALMAELLTYDYAFLYQTVGTLEDSFDIEGMAKAAKEHDKVVKRVMEAVKGESFTKLLHLGAGGCRNCRRCAKADNEPCRHPDTVTAPLEGYGVDVAQFAELCNMKYINGESTVTYFSAVFFSI